MRTTHCFQGRRFDLNQSASRTFKGYYAEKRDQPFPVRVFAYQEREKSRSSLSSYSFNFRSMSQSSTAVTDLDLAQESH